MNPLAIKAFAYALLASLLVFGGCRWQARIDGAKFDAIALQAAKDQAALAAAQVEASESARQQEQALARAANAAAEQYEQGKRDAEQAAEHVVAGLRAGNLRLRDQWQGCQARRVPGIADTASEPDAAGDSRTESAGRIVRAADECAAQVSGLQRFILSERAK